MIFNVCGQDQINDINTKLSIEDKTLNAGDTSISFTDTRINENSIFSFYTSVFGVNPTEVSVSGNTVTLTFEAQPSALIVGVRIDG